MNVDFFNIPEEVRAYVPQISEPGMNFPLILCDIDDIDPDLVGWSDTRNGYDKHNMLLDAPRKGKMKRVRLVNEEGKLIEIQTDTFIATTSGGGDVALSQQKLFSTVKHWPPSTPDAPRNT
jgi:hypothetical protein